MLFPWMVQHYNQVLPFTKKKYQLSKKKCWVNDQRRQSFLRKLILVMTLRIKRTEPNTDQVLHCLLLIGQTLVRQRGRRSNRRRIVVNN